jgi:hypothetical protein
MKERGATGRAEDFRERGSAKVKGRVPPRRLLLVLTGLLLLPSCSGWHPTPLQPEVAPTIDANDPVRVTPPNGSAVVMWHARVVGDSLIGDVGYPATRTAFALRDLRQMEELGFSQVRTGVAVLVGLSFALLFASMYSLAHGGPGS